jgi:hypothetical protein
MWVCRKSYSHYVSYDPRVKEPKLRTIIIPVQRDEIFIAELEAKVTRFVRVLLESIQELSGRVS